jgi:hypothetical protein
MAKTLSLSTSSCRNIRNTSIQSGWIVYSRFGKREKKGRVIAVKLIRGSWLRRVKQPKEKRKGVLNRKYQVILNQVSRIKQRKRKLFSHLIVKKRRDWKIKMLKWYLQKSKQSVNSILRFLWSRNFTRIMKKKSTNKKNLLSHPKLLKLIKSTKIIRLSKNIKKTKGGNLKKKVRFRLSRSNHLNPFKAKVRVNRTKSWNGAKQIWV